MFISRSPVVVCSNLFCYLVIVYESLVANRLNSCHAIMAILHRLFCVCVCAYVHMSVFFICARNTTTRMETEQREN